MRRVEEVTRFERAARNIDAQGGAAISNGDAFDLATVVLEFGDGLGVEVSERVAAMEPGEQHVAGRLGAGLVELQTRLAKTGKSAQGDAAFGRALQLAIEADNQLGDGLAIAGGSVDRLLDGHHLQPRANAIIGTRPAGRFDRGNGVRRGHIAQTLMQGGQIGVERGESARQESRILGSAFEDRRLEIPILVRLGEQIFVRTGYHAFAKGESAIDGAARIDDKNAVAGGLAGLAADVVDINEGRFEIGHGDRA